MGCTRKDENNIKSISKLQFSQEEIQSKTKIIYDTILLLSPSMKLANFSELTNKDLRLLFTQYDSIFFSNLLHKKLTNNNKTDIYFSVSNRMTRAAGKTIRSEKQSKKGKSIFSQISYEIRISRTLLLQSFSEINRTVKVNGLICTDRLEALQRVLEHEIIHLIEMLIWGKSRCAGKNFKNLSRDIFAHTNIKHELITQHEKAKVKFNIRVGNLVFFDYNGKTYKGFVNRITKRATVLVENINGRKYSDGKNYVKFYVPLSRLRKK